MNNIVSAFFQKKTMPKANPTPGEGTSPLPSPTVPLWRGMSGAGNKAL